MAAEAPPPAPRRSREAARTSKYEGRAEAPNIVPMDPLALAKGVHYYCEVCNQVATFRCENCRHTYYCGTEHAVLDFTGIHAELCKFVASLRKPQENIGISKDRQARADEQTKKKIIMIDIAVKTARQYLDLEDYDNAIPGALQSLKLATEVYGPGKTDLVQSYFLLSEAHLGLRNYQQAEEHLSLADWTIVKNADSTDMVKAQLYRQFGLLYMSQDKRHLAVERLANHIYHLARIYGPEHVNVASGYFLLGRVFAALADAHDNLDINTMRTLPENHQSVVTTRDMALYDKVVEIWHRFFTYNEVTHRRERLQDGQFGEAREMLVLISQARAAKLGKDHVDTSRCLYTIGLLHKYSNDLEAAREFVTLALQIHTEQLGPSHSETITIRATLEVIQGQQARQKQPSMLTI